MIFLPLFLISYVLAYQEPLEKKISAKYKDDPSKAGARVIILDYNNFLDIYYNATDIWHILMLNTSISRAKVCNSSWSISANNLHNKKHRDHLGKIYIDEYDQIKKFLNTTNDAFIITLDYGYMYTYTGQILVGEIMDLIVNKSYDKTVGMKILNWNGQHVFFRIIYKVFFSFAGVTFLISLIVLCFNKVKQKTL
ncbi:hypothetical protein SteCoe_21423 [Stentor coeruleus]|uniref:Uncharacterized protein n=1 Tax=Stentor coeruleus TaxID=5963 RepID=A0A1R2BPG8_9CILI|nr:hypothetical protein SteCoe_21423 [Stentor coeruleus]